VSDPARVTAGKFALPKSTERTRGLEESRMIAAVLERHRPSGLAKATATPLPSPEEDCPLPASVEAVPPRSCWGAQGALQGGGAAALGEGLAPTVREGEGVGDAVRDGDCDGAKPGLTM
jgi:hypothetical protein